MLLTMNTTQLLIAAFGFAGFSLASHAQMLPMNERVRVEVRVATESELKDIAKTTADRVTQKRTLNITLSGKPKSPETRVIKWTAYGRDLRNDQTRPIGSGEIKLALVNGTQTVESEPTTTTHTPDHAVTPKAGGGKRPNARARHVEATGTKFIGYSVQVMDGTKVVGELSDPVGIARPKAAVPEKPKAP